ncbi:MAG: transporter [Phycisphaerae bacterium]
MRRPSGSIRGIFSVIASLVAATWADAPSLAGPINTDVALTPHRGGSILRLQYIYSEAGARDRLLHLNASTVKGTYVYGVTEDVALFINVPYMNRQSDVFDSRFGRFEVAHDGIGDITFLGKVRFWQDDPGPKETYRWAAIGGINLRSGDSDFTSDSYDPIVGTVFSARRDRGRFDADLIYQFNTGGGEFRHDTLRYDVAYSHRIFPAVYQKENAWEFDLVGELNGRYTNNGSHEVFLSPGLQFITEDWVLEASVQLPVIQNLAGPEIDYRLIIGLRIQW